MHFHAITNIRHVQSKLYYPIPKCHYPHAKISQKRLIRLRAALISDQTARDSTVLKPTHTRYIRSSFVEKLPSLARVEQSQSRLARILPGNSLARKRNSYLAGAATTFARREIQFAGECFSAREMQRHDFHYTLQLLFCPKKRGREREEIYKQAKNVHRTSLDFQVNSA